MNLVTLALLCGVYAGEESEQTFVESLGDFALFRDDLQQRFRSMNVLDDFSGIINNIYLFFI